MTAHDTPEDGVNPADGAELVRRANAAIGEVAKSFDRYVEIGRAIEWGRRWAIFQSGSNSTYGKGYQAAFARWADDTRFNLKAVDAPTRSALVTIIENLPAIETWRMTLTAHQQLRWNHPTDVLKKWRKATQVPAGPIESGKATQSSPLAEARAKVAALEEQVAALIEEMNAPRQIKPAKPVKEKPIPPRPVKTVGDWIGDLAAEATNGWARIDPGERGLLIAAIRQIADNLEKRNG